MTKIKSEIIVPTRSVGSRFKQKDYEISDTSLINSFILSSKNKGNAKKSDVLSGTKKRDNKSHKTEKTKNSTKSPTKTSIMKSSTKQSSQLSKSGKSNKSDSLGKLDKSNKTNKSAKLEKASKQANNTNSTKNTRAKSKVSFSRPQKNKKDSIKITFLGGLNEIGKNITMFECGEDAFLLDCGLAFPDSDMLGVDMVIPDFSYVEANKDKIRAVVFTHGHEDHIGSLPYLFQKCNFPLYGTALTLDLVEARLKEHHFNSDVKYNIVKAGEKIKLGCMEIEFIHVNHSIPDSVAVAIHSPAGTIVHTGDFKIDFTPAKDKVTDLARFAALGHDGVLALLSDSTNAENEGFTATERKVEKALESLFFRAEGKRIIVASFASNINRIQQIIQCAHRVQRKVAFSGRSMINYMTAAEKLGYLDIPEDVIIDLESIGQYSHDELVLVTTGSQGEPMSALSRMANSDHRTVEVGENDFIILSARPIPGNEKTVSTVINELLKKGCEVVYEPGYYVHVSGHACSEEIKMILSLVNPKYFIPVHGEQRHLRKQESMALSMGMDENNIFIEDIGNVLELSKKTAKHLKPVPAGGVMVDGIGVGEVGDVVLKDRKILGDNGLVVISLCYDKKKGTILADPEIVSRGFVYVKESEELMRDIIKEVKKTIKNVKKPKANDWSAIQENIRSNVSKLLFNKMKRNPMILTVATGV